MTGSFTSRAASKGADLSREQQRKGLEEPGLYENVVCLPHLPYTHVQLMFQFKCKVGVFEKYFEGLAFTFS